MTENQGEHNFRSYIVLCEYNCFAYLTHCFSQSLFPHHFTIQICNMTDNEINPMAAFRLAKTAFEQKARKVTATDGIIDNGVILEQELVSLFENMKVLSYLCSG